MNKICCNSSWPQPFKFCPQCGRRLAGPLEQLLAYLRRNEKLSVTKKKKGHWKSWADALEQLVDEDKQGGEE